MRTLSLGLLALGLVAAVPPVGQQAPSVELAIGKSIEAGNPVDTASSFGADVGQIAGWSRVSGMAAGSKITHLWIHGADSSRVELNVGGSPWRTYSRKTIPAGATGDWTLEVLGADGAKLASKTIKIQ
jgi:hypothetical protein